MMVSSVGSVGSATAHVLKSVCDVMLSNSRETATGIVNYVLRETFPKQGTAGELYLPPYDYRRSLTTFDDMTDDSVVAFLEHNAAGLVSVTAMPDGSLAAKVVYEHLPRDLEASVTVTHAAADASLLANIARICAHRDVKRLEPGVEVRLKDDVHGAMRITDFATQSLHGRDSAIPDFERTRDEPDEPISPLGSDE